MLIHIIDKLIPSSLLSIPFSSNYIHHFHTLSSKVAFLLNKKKAYSDHADSIWHFYRQKRHILIMHSPTIQKRDFLASSISIHFFFFVKYEKVLILL